MEIILNIKEYSKQNGLSDDWEQDYVIKSQIIENEFLIVANKSGLISLAKQLLALAQDDVPSGYHLHFDEYNALETGSVELIVEKL